MKNLKLKNLTKNSKNFQGAGAAAPAAEEKKEEKKKEEKKEESEDEDMGFGLFD